MTTPDYDAVRNDPKGCAVAVLNHGILEITGRDAASFLNGQITTDTINQELGSSEPSCLLNNTGHMIADLVIHRLEDRFWIETPPDRAEIIQSTLKRFIIRERVNVLDASADVKVLTCQGEITRSKSKGASTRLGYWMTDDKESEEQNAFASSDQTIATRMHSHYPPVHGYDLIAQKEVIDALYTHFLSSGAVALSESTAHILRVESGVPAWGAELTERTIPLEAGLDDHISFSKGCYMGQEIIARIKSRGHTNWHLVKMTVSPNMKSGDELWKEGELTSGNAHCRITSVAESPDLGWIALGYIRSEFTGGDARFVGDDSSVYAQLV